MRQGRGSNSIFLIQFLPVGVPFKSRKVPGNLEARISLDVYRLSLIPSMA
jgi:hypothetical protein